MKNKIEIKKFLGMEVRVVNNEYIALKDMFMALGRVRSNGGWTDEKTKLKELLGLLGKLSDYETFLVTSKGKKKSRETQELECLKLITVPMVLTQFKPTKAKGEEALNTWIRFMKFVDDLLSSLEVYKYIVVDKDKQKTHIERAVDCGGKPIIINQMVNAIMGELMGLDISIKKDELKIYQPKTTIDLLEVREFVLDKFSTAMEFTGSHKTSKEMTLKLSKQKYNL